MHLSMLSSGEIGIDYYSGLTFFLGIRLFDGSCWIQWMMMMLGNDAYRGTTNDCVRSLFALGWVPF